MPDQDAEQLLATLRSRIESIESGNEVNGTTQHEPPDTDEFSQARNIVLRQLNASAKTRYQLYNKLLAAEIEPSTAEQVLDRFEKINLIDDAQFARDWVEQRHEFRGLAPYVLRKELQDRGVSEQDIENALNQLDRDDERIRATELIEKKMRTIPVMDPKAPEYRKEREKYTRRLVGHLQRKGYNPSMSFGIVNEKLDEHLL